jgi:plasmid stabilization system protein ParE
MRYRVLVTVQAKTNLRDYYLRAAVNAPATADRWLARFENALQSLADHPQRCGIAPENDAVEPTIRQLLFGRSTSVFRVLFTIVGDEVRILHIRRGVMANADAAEFLEGGRTD